MPNELLKHRCGEDYIIEKFFDTYAGDVHEVDSWFYCKKCNVYFYDNQEYKSRKSIIDIIQNKIVDKEMKDLEDVS